MTELRTNGNGGFIWKVAAGVAVVVAGLAFSFMLQTRGDLSSLQTAHSELKERFGRLEAKFDVIQVQLAVMVAAQQPHKQEPP